MGRNLQRLLVIGATVIVLLLVAAQFALPPFLESRVADRLTERGGRAEVELSALPAVSLLAGSGSRARIEASGLDLELTEENRVFERLDGFGEVDVRMTDVRTGPFANESIVLTREEGADEYRLQVEASATGREIAEYAASRLGPLLGAFLTRLTDDSEAARRRVPVRLDLALESDDGRARVVSGGGTVAGVPAGPLAEVIANAVVSRL